MREIKYKGFHIKSKMMFKVGAISFTTKKIRVDMSSINKSGYSPYSFDFKEVELMEFTGFKDKNGVEIYEGDIVAFDGNEWYRVDRFRDSLNGIEKEYDDYLETVVYDFEYLDMRKNDFEEYCTVVGNIHTKEMI